MEIEARVGVDCASGASVDQMGPSLCCDENTHIVESSFFSVAGRLLLIISRSLSNSREHQQGTPTSSCYKENVTWCPRGTLRYDIIFSQDVGDSRSTRFLTSRKCFRKPNIYVSWSEVFLLRRGGSPSPHVDVGGGASIIFYAFVFLIYTPRARICRLS